MCSSPKSSGTIRRSRIKGVFEDMDPSARASFVAKANAAQERRSALKSTVTRQNKMNVTRGISKKTVTKKKPSVKENFFLSFLNRMGYAV